MPTLLSRCALFLALLLAPAVLLAQPASHTAVSAPLFVEDLPVGTVSVRLARPAMTEAIAGADVTATWTPKGGKQTSRTVKTGTDGRAIFAAVPVGSTFQASAKVEGQSLVTEEFSVPNEGGTRLLMIVGADADEAMNDMTGVAAAAEDAKGPKPMGLRSGTIGAKDGLPAGTVDVRVLDESGKGVAGIKVSLGHVQNSSVEFVAAETDGSGMAHFANLPAGSSTQYAAVIEQRGLRVGSDAFSLEAKRGSAGEIRIPPRSSDLSNLRISSKSRMMLELREDGVAVLQNLILENTSDKVFDPGPAGLFIPLPSGFMGAEKLPGGSDVEIKEGAGVLLRSPLPPSASLESVAQVRVGYLVPTHEERDFEIVQPMPLGMQGGLVMIPSEFHIDLSAPGLRMRPAERDDAGNELRTFDLDMVPPGHALRLTVRGLPTHGHVGAWIAGILVGLLIVAGTVASTRVRRTAALDGKAG